MRGRHLGFNVGTGPAWAEAEMMARVARALKKTVKFIART